MKKERPDFFHCLWQRFQLQYVAIVLSVNLAHFQVHEKKMTYTPILLSLWRFRDKHSDSGVCKRNDAAVKERERNATKREN